MNAPEKVRERFEKAELALAKAFTDMIEASIALHAADPETGALQPVVDVGEEFSAEERAFHTHHQQHADAVHEAVLSVVRGAVFALAGTLEVACALDARRGMQSLSAEECAQRVLELLDTLFVTMVGEIQDDLPGIIVAVQEQRPALLAQITKMREAQPS